MAQRDTFRADMVCSDDDAGTWSALTGSESRTTQLINAMAGIRIELWKMVLILKHLGTFPPKLRKHVSTAISSDRRVCIDAPPEGPAEDDDAS